MTDRPVRFFTAVKALIRHDGRILLLREAQSYADGTHQHFYDVPGGRINPGETWDAALRREIREECGMDVTIGRPFHVSEIRMARGIEDWQILRIFFDCTATTGHVTLGSDHDDYVWVKPADLANQAIIPSLAGVIADYLTLQGLT